MKNTLIFCLLALYVPVHAQWTLLPVEGPMSFTQIWFSDPAHGYYSGADTVSIESWDGGMIMETFDGGITWDTLFNPEGGENYPYNTMFAGEIGYTSNRYSNFYRTSNGGADWELIEFDGTDFLYNAMQMPDANTILVGGYAGEVFKITDFGETIEKTLDLGLPYQVIQSMQCVGEDTCYLETYREIYRTIDRGDTWSVIYTSPEIEIMGIYVYPNHEIMRAVFDESYGLALLHSEDAAATWDTVSIIDPESGNFSKMIFLDSIGYIIGDDYMLKQTTDSGKHWVDILLDTIPDRYGFLSDIQLFDAHTGFISGYNGLFYSMGVPTEIAPIQEPQSINLYPNPTSDLLYGDFLPNMPVEVYNTLGQLLLQSQLTDIGSINVSALPAGFYIVHQLERTGVFVKQN